MRPKNTNNTTPIPSANPRRSYDPIHLGLEIGENDATEMGWRHEGQKKDRNAGPNIGNKKEHHNI